MILSSDDYWSGIEIHDHLQISGCLTIGKTMDKNLDLRILTKICMAVCMKGIVLVEWHDSNMGYCR